MRGLCLLGLLLTVAALPVENANGTNQTGGQPNRTGITQEADDTAKLEADEETVAAIAAEKAGLLLVKKNVTRVLPTPSGVALGPYDSSLGMVLDATMKGMDLPTMTMAREEAFPGAFKEQDYEREFAAEQHREAVRTGTVTEAAAEPNPYRKQQPADATIADSVLFNTTDSCKHCMFSMLSLQKMYIEAVPVAPYNDTVTEAIIRARNESVCALVVRSYFPNVYGIVLKELSNKIELLHQEAIDECVRGLKNMAPVFASPTCTTKEHLGIRSQLMYTTVEKRMNSLAKRARIEYIRSGIRTMTSARDAMKLCATGCGVCNCPEGYQCAKPLPLVDVPPFVASQKAHTTEADFERARAVDVQREALAASNNKRFIMPPNVTLADAPKASLAMNAARLAKLQAAEKVKLATIEAAMRFDPDDRAEEMPQDELAEPDMAQIHPPLAPETADLTICSNVTLFELPGFAGRKYVMKEGEHSHANLMSKLGGKAASAKFADDCVLAVYQDQNFGTGVQYLDKDVDDFAKVGFAGLGSNLQSVKVLPATGKIPVTAQVKISIDYSLVASDQAAFDQAFVTDMGSTLGIPKQFISIVSTRAAYEGASFLQAASDVNATANATNPTPKPQPAASMGPTGNIFGTTVVIFRVSGGSAAVAAPKLTQIIRQQLNQNGNRTRITLVTGALSLQLGRSVSFSGFVNMSPKKAGKAIADVGFSPVDTTGPIKTDQVCVGGKAITLSKATTASACANKCAKHAICEAFNFQNGDCTLLDRITGFEPKMGSYAGLFKLPVAAKSDGLLSFTYPIESPESAGRMSACGNQVGRFKVASLTQCQSKCETTPPCNTGNYARGRCVLEVCPREEILPTPPAPVNSTGNSTPPAPPAPVPEPVPEDYFGPEMMGYCVRKDGVDENEGTKLLAGGDWSAKKPECLAMCAAHVGYTGCEINSNPSSKNQGCNVHTSAQIDRGNENGKYLCYVKKGPTAKPAEDKFDPETKGYCVRKDGVDENEGTKLLSGGDWSDKKPECLALCAAHKGYTGCEINNNPSSKNQGCNVHTSDKIDKGNANDKYFCYVKIGRPKAKPAEDNFDPEMPGYCVRKDGADENEGTKLLAGGDWSAKKPECLALCAAHKGYTGCEINNNPSSKNQGCNVHTSAKIDRGNANGKYFCYVKKEPVPDDNFGLEMPGYCVRKDGADENEGTKLLSGGDWSAKKLECLALCAAHEGYTGCEINNNPSSKNQGCNVHTSDKIDRGNANDKYFCYVKKDPAAAAIAKPAHVSVVANSSAVKNPMRIVIKTTTEFGAFTIFKQVSIKTKAVSEDAVTIIATQSKKNSSNVTAPMEKQGSCASRENVKPSDGTVIQQMANSNSEDCCSACYQEKKCEQWLMATLHGKCILYKGVSTYVSDPLFTPGNFRLGKVERAPNQCEANALQDTTTVGGEVVLKKTGVASGVCCSLCLNNDECETWKHTTTGDCLMMKNVVGETTLLGSTIGKKKSQ